MPTTADVPADAAEQIRRGVADARTCARSNPLGVAVLVEPDVYRPQLLDWIRQQTFDVSGFGYYIPLSAPGRSGGFWSEVLRSFNDGLHAGDQNLRLLSHLASKAGLDRPAADAVIGWQPPTPEDVEAFITALRCLDRHVGLECKDTARALVLDAASNPGLRRLGTAYLTGADVGANQLAAWRIRTHDGPPGLLVQQISWLLALSGPTVVVADLCAAIKDPRAQIACATGLMDIRELTRRTLNVLICSPDRWERLNRHATGGAWVDRFRLTRLPSIPT